MPSPKAKSSGVFVTSLEGKTARTGLNPVLLTPFFLVLFILLFSISPVYAEADLDFTAIPQNIADKMGIPLFAGQLLCSAILLFIFILPFTLLSRRRGTSPIAELVLGLAIMGVCLALGWLPYWILLILALLVALMYANQIKGIFSR